ncbi:MAG: cohesin domain-containing protein [Anaerolineaceae bacterium]|nr:cohesin domain-containing protein [Anaerolineaceae bacterium]
MKLYKLFYQTATLVVVLCLALAGSTSAAAKAPAVPAQAGTALMSMQASSTSVNVGDTFNVTVQVAAGTQEVDTVQASIDFDPNYLEVVAQPTSSGVLTTPLSNVFDNTLGTVDFGAGLLGSSTSGTFSVVTIQFRVKASTSATTLSFHSGLPRETNVLYQGNSVFAGGTGVTITVSGGGGGATPTPVPGTTPAPNPGSYPYPYYYPYYYGNIPTFSILSVVTDDKVTVQTYNFPANKDFIVRMGPYGGYGIGGVEVGTLNSGAGGSFQATFDIPAALKGKYQIAIRMDSTTGGYYSFNWFYNNTTISSGGSYIPTGIPYTDVISVVQGQKVTLQTYNFPPNLDFTVRIGAYGTYGINGIVVATTNSGTGGSFQVTYDIPAALQGNNMLSIRMENPATGYFAYDWFYNTDGGGYTPPPGSVPPTYTGFPYTSVTNVVKDTSVTLQTYNFPPNLDFTVRINTFGTYGVNGVVVDTINSGAGGSFPVTLNIPAQFTGVPMLAIRFENPYTGHHAFDWFYNQ